MWPEKPPLLKRSQVQRALIAAGRHPFMGGAIRTDGETCGSCRHAVKRRYSRSYTKCELRETRGLTTDIRASWPGCGRWEARIEQVRTDERIARALRVVVTEWWSGNAACEAAVARAGEE